MDWNVKKWRWVHEEEDSIKEWWKGLYNWDNNTGLINKESVLEPFDKTGTCPQIMPCKDFSLL